MSGICSSKELIEKYFAEGDNDVWTCKCKKSRKKGKGWANLIDHIQREHADTLEAAKKKGSGPILQFFSKKDTNLFSWVEWIVKDLLPFRFCENAVVKIQMAQQCNEQLALNRAQELCVQHLKKPLDNPGVEEIQPQPQPTDLQALMKKIKKRKMEASSSSGCSTSTSSYIDVRFIRPTSNKCERQFSVAGFAFTKNRQGLLPINLEMQLFLNANQHLWDLELFYSNDNE
jgi:hypothetical protein